MQWTVSERGRKTNNYAASRGVLLVDEMQRELVLVGADLVADAALPRTRVAVQRRVQEEHASLEEQDVAVLTLEQAALADVERDDVIEGRQHLRRGRGWVLA